MVTTDVFRPWGLYQDNKKDNSTNRTGMGLLPTPLHFKYIEDSYLGTRDTTTQAVLPPLQSTPTKQNNKPTEAPKKPSKISQRTPIPLPGPVPAQLFVGPAQHSADAQPVQRKVSYLQDYLVPPPQVYQPVQATSSGPQLTPKTLELMGYKRVNDLIIRCDPPKPKKSRWS